MTPKQMRLLAILATQQVLIRDLYVLFFEHRPDPLREFDEHSKAVLAGLDAATFKQIEPALSDALAQQCADEAAKLLASTARGIAARRQPRR